LSTGYVANGYGLLGYSYPNNNESLYWATDTSGQAASPGSNASYFGALLSELQCPTSSDNNTCTDTGTLYESWNSEVWDFGTSQQLPGLIMGDRVYRDNDGDGALDEYDAFPDIFAASIDIDGDGAPDRWTGSCDAACAEQSGLIYDAVPSSAAAYLDADFDGLVDEWADGCDTACQTSSGLTYDDYPDDHDNDGIIDAVDTDDNNDGILDADADSDGLLDIASLEELNAIRFSLDGSGQVMIEGNLPDSSGCPIILWLGIAQQRCHGYELISDLDFDTNSDGQLNEQDTYWNAGQGWEPIGSSHSDAYTADFHGNGHQISNLYIDISGNAGLFGYIDGDELQPIEISEVVISGPMTSVTGGDEAGVLAGRVENSKIDRVFVTGEVNAEWEAGGLAGATFNSTVSNVFSSAAIVIGNNQGGLIGNLKNSTLSNSLATGYVENGYGLLRFSAFNDNSYLYWATDTSGQKTSQGSHASYFGVLLSELQCPTSSDNDTCTDRGTLYESWNNEVWDFGTGQQLPALVMGGRIYRDSDGDGVLDGNDAYPDTFAASLDTDSDGSPDRFTLGCDASCRIDSGLMLDAFPTSAAAYRDTDLDGLVDDWADGCDTTCQTNSGLSYVDYPDDRDNDGITDAVDTDDNNDGIIDADADSDGLIDIASLEELNAIRFALDGSGQIMIDEGLWDNSGCPIMLWQGIAQQRCDGYELVADLDFDTNGDGQMNERDNYWNDGEGWEPIGANSLDPFTTNFHGNGHQIRNLYIDRSGNAGLFGYIEGYEVQPIKISEVVLAGPMTSITGGYHTGVFSGAIHHAKVDGLFISGTVNGEIYVGGLAGRTINSSVSNVFSSAVILEGYNKGGIIGRLYSADLSNSLATGYVEGRGGLIGAGFFDSNEFLYWATDTTGQSTSSGTNASYFGALLSELQCPTSSDNSTCTDKGTLYENWDTEVWDFGSDRQLPGLIMNGVVYRDSDGDGALDEDDAYPDTFAASLDTDKDGYPDNYSRGCSSICVVESGLFLDAFPENSAGWMDADLDGLVDKWTDGCDTTCQTSSGLTFDDYPNDHDNDGISDAIDTDDNNDGIVDADADSDGLIDIASLEELNAIRFAPEGSGQVMTEESLSDTSGCPVILWQGIAHQRCGGYELISDLDFDTNGDGQMNELDNYWNDGEGWEPIGSSYSSAFNANFHGNGHQINNLYIDRSGNAGLFGYVNGDELQSIKISEVVLLGPMTSITGGDEAGVLRYLSDAVLRAETAGAVTREQAQKMLTRAPPLARELMRMEQLPPLPVPEKKGGTQAKTERALAV
ncbi:MAG: autotransporter subunit C, partial [Pseudomonadota bacterium]|nr:autotransporter subunit C [Pseudomonadota bacterium]